MVVNGLVHVALHVIVPQANLLNGPILNVAMAPRSSDTDVFVLMTMLRLCCTRICHEIQLVWIFLCLSLLA